MFPVRVFWQRPTSASAVADEDVREGTVNGASLGTLDLPDVKYVSRRATFDNGTKRGEMPVLEGE